MEYILADQITLFSLGLSSLPVFEFGAGGSEVMGLVIGGVVVFS